MDFIDVKYINLISSRLQKFKRIKPNLYNCRCPICGDSQKNRNKARGFFYQIKNNTNYKCHNCGVNISLNNFLKDIDPQTHKQYVFEKFKGNNTGKVIPTETPEDIFSRLNTKPKFKKRVEMDLPDAFSVDKSKHYLESRAILSGKFYYAKNFQEFVNTIKPGTFDNTKYGEERIVIPLIKDERLIGVQGRALSTNPVKYLTIMMDDDDPKIYGLERIDTKLPVYVVEGPFDSTFLDNSVALCGSDGDVGCLEGSDLVFVYDNEPRNKEIVRRISDTIERGNKVVIWPSNITEKDINDMVLGGYNVKDLIQSNTFEGLQAKLKFTTWKRI
jgi:hypothetical protein